MCACILFFSTVLLQVTQVGHQEILLEAVEQLQALVKEKRERERGREGGRERERERER